MAFGEPELTEREFELLKPHADHYYAMGSFIRRADQKLLEETMEACQRHGMTNCGWAAYNASQYLMKEILVELAVRKRQTMPAA